MTIPRILIPLKLESLRQAARGYSLVLLGLLDAGVMEVFRGAKPTLYGEAGLSTTVRRCHVRKDRILPHAGLFRPAQVWSIFTPYLMHGETLEAHSLRGLSSFFGGSIGRVFHNILYGLYRFYVRSIITCVRKQHSREGYGLIKWLCSPYTWERP